MHVSSGRWLHGLFLSIGVGLFCWTPLQLKLASRRAVKEMAHGQA